MNLSLLMPKKRKIIHDSKTDVKIKRRSKGAGSSILNFLQELGKSLQYPIAILPFAAILNRFGALGVTYSTVHGSLANGISNQAGYWISFIIQQPGLVVFNNLPIIFAIGVAFGLAEDHRGEVALIGGVFYLVLAAFTSVEHSLPNMLYDHVLTFTSYSDAKGTVAGHFSSLIYVPTYTANGNSSYVSGGTYVLNIGVLGGITAGCLSASLYNKYKGIKLPAALSFFGGRRFVPMVALVVSIPTAFAFAIVWPWIQYVLMKFGTAVANPDNPAVAIPGTAAYGVLNRLLLPFGLHQILNTFFWFQLPIHGVKIDPITGHPGAAFWVNGDIPAFTQGITGAGLFQSGFFPIMMGGIPAIALAMIYTAKPENRVKVAGFLGGVALVSFISGITEPIEFSFVFISPLLLAIHALITGCFMAIATSMHIQVGFGFSAGLIDYCVSFAQSWGFANHNTGITHVTANPLWILPLTALAGVVYFTVFTYLIKKLNIQTPGREEEGSESSNPYMQDSSASSDKKDAKKADKKVAKADKYTTMATKIIAAIGADNFVSIDNCATRLRLILKDTGKIDQAAIKAAGAYGVMVLTKESLQVVIGPDVEHVVNAMNQQIKV